MVEPKFRSRSRKRIKRVTPGGRRVTRYESPKTGKGKCGRCGRILSWSAERVYGGVLCGSCVGSLFRYVTMSEAKFTNPNLKNIEVHRDLTLERFLPVGWWANVSGGKITLKKESKKFEKKKSKPEAKTEKPVKNKSSAKKQKAEDKVKKKGKVKKTKKGAK